MYTLTIDGQINAPFLKTLIGPGDPWGFGPAEDPSFQTIMFDENMSDAVLAAIENYDEAWLANEKLPVIEAVAANRKATIINSFSFNGMPIKLDPDTENAISKAYSALSRQPEGASVDWEVTRGVFVEFNLSIVSALSDAAFLHVQNCFSNAKRLTALINAAEDLEALYAIDLNDGWPS